MCFLIEMVGTFLCLVSVVVDVALAAFDPTMTIDSCTKRKLEITLNNASASGIVYIQGQSSVCRYPTTDGVSVHSFDFASCNLQWEESFNVIVQKNALYQTGADKQIPVMCVADIGDLTVSNSLHVADKDDAAGQNLTVKPSAFMTLYRNGVDISGQTVKLTDIITMVLKLDSEYIGDFDIKAKYCAADNIDIIVDACAVDSDLFPHISRIQQGVLQASFGAFRTTNLNGGSVSMPFSCVLQVCLGVCAPTVCTDGQTSYGRKKRHVARRQVDEDKDIENISVGSVLSITSEEVIIGAPNDDGDVCTSQGLFVLILNVMIAVVVATAVSAVLMYRKLQEKSRIISKFNSDTHMTGLTSYLQCYPLLNLKSYRET
ncbi:uncharacterized protein LOC127857978 isoform X2 [Dreissena polymorpha]|uniref:ZP domain-containing protein n=1 Tax=Dreissena polymorpha TaxID=45954 RepID=A0A9D4BV07_DREPO|nr:uncharacterized protein LOC127857978 isoform X1 [Dreissena polymorpha]XP_052250737.1 uncharacterized protein LOC127857978 isoform X1 [Dreissena polymorpha]XP_052250738.1 uncharacterized protein LOC127857978 isoform X1 [Dreissena polymorpha]XP_052250739.1 uncharacterized protein LOC127857978 isoform X1 [Dreissena polymorpha]XP_052250740.1 uncharacterized protein LOC127857978 isoform X2 [Dreissena polymorpha]XP_052250741.1 uncharacterized protein LOC127857978 isoform X2 [Dreissena polymorpha]